MQPAIISDTSCLILLDKIDELAVLQKLFGTVTITQIIAEEFKRQLPDWIVIENPVSFISKAIIEATLDPGEASAIALALEKRDCLLIIDELKGRKLATLLGIAITGTLGLLADAKQRGLITALKPVLDKMQKTDFRVGKSLIKEVLKQTGE